MLKAVKLSVFMLFLSVSPIYAQQMEEPAGDEGEQPTAPVEKPTGRIEPVRILLPESPQLTGPSPTARPCVSNFGQKTTAFDGGNCGFSDIALPNLSRVSVSCNGSFTFLGCVNL